MITVRDATLKAREFLNQVVGVQPSNMSLEEVESDEQNIHWLITLSYNLPNSSAIPPLTLYPTYATHYKVFKINKSTGEVVSMKMKSTDSSK